MSDNLPEGVKELDAAPVAGSVPVSPAQGVSPALANMTKKVKLEDGRIVTFTKPKRSLTFFINEILREVKNPVVYEIERVRVKMMLYITAIDGKPVEMIFDQTSREALEEELGDDYLDSLLVAFSELYPAKSAIAIDVVKKS